MTEEGARRSDKPDGMGVMVQLRLRWELKVSSCTEQISNSDLMCIIDITYNYQLREESEDLLKQLHISLEAEWMEERDKLETQKKQELELLKNKLDLELQAANKRLEELRESAQKEMEREEQKLRSDVRWINIFFDFIQLVMDILIESMFLLLAVCLNTDEKRWINNLNSLSREENLNFLKELRDRLKAERVAERNRLEAQKGQEMEQLKAELDMELQAERRKVQEDREDKLVSVKKVTADE